MPAFYYSSTAGSYTLTGGVSAAATTIVLNSVSGLPTSTPFKVVLEPGQPTEEIVKVTGVAGTSLTVVRGWDGTAAASHGAAVTVRHMVTAEDFTLSRTHEDATAAHGATGAVVGTTNAQTITNKDFSSGTNTFPASFVTLTGAQTLVSKSVSPPNAAGAALTLNTDPTRVADFARYVDPTFGVVAKITSGSFNAGPDGFRAYFNVNAGLLKQQVNITASAVDVRPLVVKGFAAQTANLQEWRKSDETVLASVDKDGNLAATNIGVAIHVARTTTLAANDGVDVAFPLFQTTLKSAGIPISAGVATVPQDGLYLWNGHCVWGAAAAVTSGPGRRRLYVKVNGASVSPGMDDDMPPSGTSLNSSKSMTVSGVLTLTAGQTVQLWALNSTGVNLTINAGAEFSLIRLA